jgi:hypothetical protein
MPGLTLRRRQLRVSASCRDPATAHIGGNATRLKYRKTVARGLKRLLYKKPAVFYDVKLFKYI